MSVQSTTSGQITDRVLEAMAGGSDPRLAEVMQSLVRHLHDFARDVRLQPEELLAGARFLTACGQISSDVRHELILLADTLGLTMVVDTLTAPVPQGALESSVLGPFYRAHAPRRELGADLSLGVDDGEPLHVHGRVMDVEGRPVAGATLDVWSTNASGLYENVDPAQPDWNLRGRFDAADDGGYAFWTAKPVPYPIPGDGPVGQLLAGTGRHNMRPGHLHVIVQAPGHRTVVSELFTADDPYVDSDAVFGVKASLVVRHAWVDEPAALAAAGRAAPFWDLDRDLVLSPGEHRPVAFTTARQA